MSYGNEDVTTILEIPGQNRTGNTKEENINLTQEENVIRCSTEEIISDPRILKCCDVCTLIQTVNNYFNYIYK